MALPSEQSEVDYVGNNSTVTPYPVPFKFYLATDLVVIVTDEFGEDTTLTLITDYTVTGGNPQVGATGAIITTEVIPATSTVTILRTVELTQETEFTDIGKFPSQSVDKSLDLLTMMAQQAARQLARCLQIPESREAFLVKLTPEGNVIIGLDEDGQPRVFTASQLISFLQISGGLLVGPVGDLIANSVTTGAILVSNNGGLCWPNGESLIPLEGVSAGAHGILTDAGGIIIMDSTITNLRAFFAFSYLLFSGGGIQDDGNSGMFFNGTSAQIDSGGHGKFIGISDGSNAAAGKVGEYQEAILESMGVSITNTTNTNITTLSLSPGDWDVGGVVVYDVAGSITPFIYYGVVTTVSAELGPSYYRSSILGPNTSLTLSCGVDAPTRRFNLTSTTTIYLVGRMDFSGAGVVAGRGRIWARRAR